MSKYCKKPVVIDAVQWNGKNYDEICEFASGTLIDSIGGGMLKIPTLEGDHIASVGDWIIKGAVGEFYPCKPHIFERTYESVEGEGE